MTENKPITVYTADCIGNAANCRYPNEVNITDEVTAKPAFSKDMVCAKYKNSHRSVPNFETANALPMDCDNDHSDIPADWITPEDIAEFFADVPYVLLKGLGISVYFEEQSIDTATADGELMLSILASYAQEESLSASENQKWRVKRNFEEGIPWRFFMLGYRRENGKLAIVPEEAEIVRSIFTDYLAGKGVTAITRRLNESGYVTQNGCVFHKSAVERILRNYTYTGNLLLQTKFRENHLTKVTRKNQGELPRYHASDTHEAIIPLETFNAVQAEIRRRKEKYAPTKPQQSSPFTGLITCAICNKHYRRKTTATGPVWICSTYNSYGKSYCPSKAIPEEKLMQTVALVGHTGEITAITAHNDNLLEFTLKDGTNAVKRWQDRSRAESWTAEMRRAVGEKTRERNQRHAES